MSNSREPNYCCPEKCFILKSLEVDGMAYRKCKCFSQCHCKCCTWMREQQYCCEEKCFVISPIEKVKGLACGRCRQYSYCYCHCCTFQSKQKCK